MDIQSPVHLLSCLCRAEPDLRFTRARLVSVLRSSFQLDSSPNKNSHVHKSKPVSANSLSKSTKISRPQSTPLPPIHKHDLSINHSTKPSRNNKVLFYSPVNSTNSFPALPAVLTVSVNANSTKESKSDNTNLWIDMVIRGINRYYTCLDPDKQDTIDGRIFLCDLRYDTKNS